MGIQRITPRLADSVSARTAYRREVQKRAMIAVNVAQGLSGIQVGGLNWRVLRGLRGLGVLVNNGSGSLVDMSPEAAAAQWANPGGPGATAFYGTNGAIVGYTYTQPMNYRAPQPDAATSDMYSTGSPIFPGSTAPSLPSYLSNVVEQSENVCMGQPNSPSCKLSASDMATIALQFCANAGSVPGCDNPQAGAQTALTTLNTYQARLAAFEANPSAATGQPVYLTAGGGSTAFSIPPIPATPVVAIQTGTGIANPSGGGGVTATGNGAPSGPGLTTSALIENITRPGSSNFVVGDTWRLTIKGSPNQVVKGGAQHNGADMGVTLFGSTDANGTRILSGQMAADTAGLWVETWQVGTGNPVQISFTVTAAGAAPGGASNQTGGGGSTSTGAGSETSTTQGTGFGSGSAGDFVSKNMVWFAAAAVALFLLKK